MSPLSSPAYRFRDGNLVLGAETVWPDCEDLNRAGGACSNDAVYGYLNGGEIHFCCRTHEREYRHEDRDPWPLIPESEMHDVDSRT